MKENEIISGLQKLLESQDLSKDSQQNIMLWKERFLNTPTDNIDYTKENLYFSQCVFVSQYVIKILGIKVPQEDLDMGPTGLGLYRKDEHGNITEKWKEYSKQGNLGAE